MPAAPNGTGAARGWRPCTLALAAGGTDQGWTLKEVLLFRVPPWPQMQMGENMAWLMPVVVSG
jgi:hypothetical protein